MNSVVADPTVPIGGRWAIALVPSLWLFPIFIFVTPIIEPATPNRQSFLDWTIASSLSLIPPLFIVYIAHLTYFKNRAMRPRPGYSVIILGLLAGAAKGATLSTLASMLDLLPSSENHDLIFRTINAALIGALFFPLMSLFWATRERFITKRANITQEISNLISGIQASAEVTKILRGSVISKTDNAISEILSTTKNYFNQISSFSTEKQWAGLAEHLRTSATETVSPLSHALNLSDIDKTETESHQPWYSNLSVDFRPTIPWIVALFAVTSFKGIIDTLGLRVGSVAFITRIVLLAPIFYFANFLLSRFKSAKGGYVTLALFLASLSLTIFNSEVSKLIGHPITFAQNVVGFLWIFFLAVVTEAINSQLRFQNKRFVLLTEIVDQKRIDAAIARREEILISRQIARYLHGSLQSTFMGSALAIEKAGLGGDEKLLKQEIVKAYEKLMMPSDDYFTRPVTNFDEELALVISKWIGMVSILSEVNLPERNLHSELIRELGDAINEAIANAFRHGRASEVRINVASDRPGHLLLTIDDNGTGPTLGNPGFGSDIYDSLVGASWFLKKSEIMSGAVLHMEVLY
ncbi:MAG: hypothetical protein D4R83_08055 [Streptomycetaceae bacterium]|nr:MAG: hypothetical protein D4R83_08055 [Streptomycetaceae bacterium]